MANQNQNERSYIIKQLNVLFQKTQCKKCGTRFVHEKMWQVSKVECGEVKEYFFYCLHCFPTQDDVLKELETIED